MKIISGATVYLTGSDGSKAETLSDKEGKYNFKEETVTDKEGKYYFKLRPDVVY